MAGMKRSLFAEVVDGYFLPSREDCENKDEDEEVEEGEADDDIHMLDMDEMETVENGGNLARSQPVAEKTVLFKVFKGGKEINICGKFLMTDPWWAATVRLKTTRRKGLRFMAGNPEYRLRDDPGVKTQNLVYLFLTNAMTGADKQHVDAFFEQIKSWGEVVSFQNMLELLERFKLAIPSNDERSGMAENIISHLQSSESGGTVYKYLTQNLQDFFRWIPQLLPRHFLHFLQDGDKDGKRRFQNTICQEFNKALTKEPWVFGFSPVLRYKFSVVGCEATLQSYKACGIFDKLSPLHQDALYIYDMLKKESRGKGHTFLYENSITPKKLDDHKVTNYRKAFQFLVDNYIIVRENGRVYLRYLWKAEEEIKRGIGTMLTCEPWTFDIDFDRPEFQQIAQDEDQKLAAQVISQNAVTVLSGKGGCGKTTVVSSVFRHAQKLDNKTEDQGFEREEITPFNEEKDMMNDVQLEFSGTMDMPENQEFGEKQKLKTDITVLLTAPTGKAANILGRRSQLPSFTLHQVLWSWRMHLKKVKNSNEEDPEWKFKHVKAVVVDESSLVSVCLFNNMFQLLLQHADLKKLVVLGDVNQLPSIDPGNFLSDLYDSLHDSGCSILLKQNHRSESKAIVENAERISKLEVPLFNKEDKFFEVTIPENDDGPGIDGAVRSLLSGQDPCIGTVENSQFVAFRNKDCERINEICCLHYVGHSIKDPRGRFDFRPGDKVCCRKNGSVTDHSQKEKVQRRLKRRKIAARECSAMPFGSTFDETENETNAGAAVSQENDSETEDEDDAIELKPRLCNGEVFFIEDDITVETLNNKQRFLVLDDRDPDHRRIIKVCYREVMSQCKLRHAWARTIHTYQGSESETVTYVVGKAYGQNWKHVYTAVTRGRKQVIILSEKSQLKAAVGTVARKRNTSLYERLTKLIGELKKKRRMQGPSLKPAVPHAVAKPDETINPALPSISKKEESLDFEYAQAVDSSEEDALELSVYFDDSGLIRFNHTTGMINHLSSDGNRCQEKPLQDIPDLPVSNITDKEKEDSLTKGGITQNKAEGRKETDVNSTPQQEDQIPTVSEYSVINDSELFSVAESMETALAKDDKSNLELARPIEESSETDVLDLPSISSPLKNDFLRRPCAQKTREVARLPHQTTSMKSPLVSPKRKAQPSFSTPSTPNKKPTTTALYDGMCDHCMSPIRKGIDNITFHKTPYTPTQGLSTSFQKKWIHVACDISTSSDEQ
ncbi:DNA helicase B isoform X2 [Lingula anatina]|uniref:DNA helicase B isoform X2 n=1 Tax=Lingula anatina TaxID=7574 RepID=A0A1S3H8T6_LINAN|nr:DNA helicase B isoform X2 [Lingula anatina]|eukprot:XP_013382500.1 DNA helicase B isoform X2 [Lingula anatina]